MSITLLGINHRSAPLNIRERLSISCGEEEKTLAQLKDIPHAGEVMYLSTCNRFEVLVNTKSGDAIEEDFKRHLSYRRGNLSPVRNGKNVSICTVMKMRCAISSGWRQVSIQ